MITLTFLQAFMLAFQTGIMMVLQFKDLVPEGTLSTFQHVKIMYGLVNTDSYK